MSRAGRRSRGHWSSSNGDRPLIRRKKENARTDVVWVLLSSVGWMNLVICDPATKSLQWQCETTTPTVQFCSGSLPRHSSSHFLSQTREREQRRSRKWSMSQCGRIHTLNVRSEWSSTVQTDRDQFKYINRSYLSNDICCSEMRFLKYQDFSGEWGHRYCSHMKKEERKKEYTVTFWVWRDVLIAAVTRTTCWV